VFMRGDWHRFADEMRPRCVFPALVGRLKYAEVQRSMVRYARSMYLSVKDQ
jgi:hypothetical protein